MSHLIRMKFDTHLYTFFSLYNRRFDGDIPQLQTMICEAREATDIALNIIRNKHPAAATGSYQPCDLSPVFRLLKFVASRSTAKNSHAVSHLRKNLEEIFSVSLRLKGLNLDHNPRKKKALMDLLLCMPENYEAVLKEKHGQKSFLDAGMIDEELKMCPNIDSLMANCKRWGSMNKNIGISREMKLHIKEQLLPLLVDYQLPIGQVTSVEMTPLDIPRGK